MDPCVDIDDHLPEQANKFLKSFQKHLAQGNTQKPSSGTVQTERLEQPEHPPTERGGRKSTIRLKEALEFMDSPILSQQPSRCSLLQTPTMAPIPFARSTPTQLGTKQVFTSIGNKQKFVKVFPAFQSKQDLPLIQSPIDIRSPQFDPTSSLLEEKVRKIPEHHSSLPKALEIAPSIRHEWTEPITYRRDNYAHFISEYCEIFLQLNHFDDTNWGDVWSGLLNFKIALGRDQCETCRMSNSDDLLGALSQNRMTELLSDIFLTGHSGSTHIGEKGNEL